MPTGPRLLIDNACYHIITRGNQKQLVFIDNYDKDEFNRRLSKYKKKHGYLLYGYCLMPNHIHLVGEPKQTIKLSKFMHGLLRSYTVYFNKRYKKVGHLWQDRFKSKIIVKDGYLIDCIHYIEFNPVRAKIVQSAADYAWSSYQERVLLHGKAGKLLDDFQI
jgi:putative transposase